MILPDSNQSIYPLSHENIRAILNFFFESQEDGNLDFLFSKEDLETNQLEFIARKVSENISFFREKLGVQLTISNLMKYGVDALTKNEEEWNGSKSRNRITKEFRELIINQEAKILEE